MGDTDFGDIHGELKTHTLSSIVTLFYKLLKGKYRRSVANFCIKLLFKLEGGPYRSKTVRKLMARDYSVEVGVHSYGELFLPGAFPPSVKIGKYVSVAKGVRVFTQNHPIDWLTTHPYFYEAGFGIVEPGMLEPATTEIGNDVWLGQGAIILPGCKRIGNGAIIGAGSVITKDVPDYAIVAGNPGKILRYRFDEETIKWLLENSWWDMSLEELSSHKENICRPLDISEYTNLTENNVQLSRRLTTPKLVHIRKN